jgi:hypothetical protein
MRDHFPDPQELHERAAKRLQRREEVRRRVRRQRRVAASALLILAGGVVLVGLLSFRGGGDHRVANSEFQITSAASRIDWQPHEGPVPILEYHVLGRPPAEAAYPELYVSRPDFRKQMDWLDQQGYEAVTLEQVEDAWYHGGTLPEKPAVLSFDDGYRPQYTFALPTLREHGWPGC